MSLTETKSFAPILLFDGECAVCRRIGHWVQKSASRTAAVNLVARPIGNDPTELLSLNPAPDIWDAYANIHVLMPDGSMKIGGEAVAEVLRDLPKTRWFAWSFRISLFGFRPFQSILNLAYLILSDLRPLFGCESCGTPSGWVKPIRRLVKWTKTAFVRSPVKTNPHFTSISTIRKTTSPAGEEVSTTTSEDYDHAK